MNLQTLSRTIARPGPVRAILRLSGDDLQQAKSDLAAAQFDLARAQQEAAALDAEIAAREKIKDDKLRGLSVRWIAAGAGALLLLLLLPGGR